MSTNRNLMQSYSKLPCLAYVRSLEQFLPIMWMPATPQKQRKRLLLMLRATLTPNLLIPLSTFIYLIILFSEIYQIDKKSNIWLIMLLWFSLFYSTIIPEKLDGFINRYAEYTHDRWAFEKVHIILSIYLSIYLIILYYLSIDLSIYRFARWLVVCYLSICIRVLPVPFNPPDPKQLDFWWGVGWKCQDSSHAQALQNILWKGNRHHILHFHSLRLHSAIWLFVSVSYHMF